MTFVIKDKQNVDETSVNANLGKHGKIKDHRSFSYTKYSTMGAIGTIERDPATVLLFG